jgi:regulator of sigma E protease
VVADVVEETPAARLNIPRGALLRAIDGEPVQNWLDVLRVLRASAGRTDAVRYRSDPSDPHAPQAEGALTVPSSVVNELGLSPQAMIVSINGQTRTAVPGDLSVRLPNWLAVRALLEKQAGKTVTIRYQRSLGDLTIQEAQFHVRADLSNVDPWQMRIQFVNPDLPFKPLETTIQTSNPLVAAQLGVRATRDVLVEVYRTIKTIIGGIGSKRPSTVQYISGPVGIVGFAIDRARAGSAELLYFLAFLSVNLAVLNFLPFPVVDGGLMVFLIIEKLKGKPLSVKTQMVATLVGLATIVLVFLLITIQDITKFFT